VLDSFLFPIFLGRSSLLRGFESTVFSRRPPVFRRRSPVGVPVTFRHVVQHRNIGPKDWIEISGPVDATASPRRDEPLPCRPARNFCATTHPRTLEETAPFFLNLTPRPPHKAGRVWKRRRRQRPASLARYGLPGINPGQRLAPRRRVRPLCARQWLAGAVRSTTRDSMPARRTSSRPSTFYRFKTLPASVDFSVRLGQVRRPTRVHFLSNRIPFRPPPHTMPRYPALAGLDPWTRALACCPPSEVDTSISYVADARSNGALVDAACPAAPGRRWHRSSPALCPGKPEPPISAPPSRAPPAKSGPSLSLQCSRATGLCSPRNATACARAALGRRRGLHKKHRRKPAIIIA